jgi:hypothetical protein
MKNLLLFFVFCCSTVFGYYPNLDNSPHLTDKQKELIAPHLLPLDHPIKPIVDKIFSLIRVTESKENIEKAGFKIMVAMPRSYTVVAKHPWAPGYVFKIHLDSEKKGRMGKDSWEWLIDRCVHAKTIKKIIEKKKLVHFSVPDKWLYPPPVFPASSLGTPQPIILIATEKDVEPDHISTIRWRTIPNRDYLKELYQILKSGSGSPHLGSNVPYAKDGTFCFIDTERKNSFRSNKRAKKYFADEFHDYWLSLF